jgi:hypothetical protein
MTNSEAFLDGERPTDVHIFLHENAVSNVEALADHGTRTEDGIVLVLDGERARDVFRSATGIDPMVFAKEAMGTEGRIHADCAGGICPACGEDEARFVFAFAEEQNDEVGGLYAEGTVIHAYVSCACGEAYSGKWVAAERSGA